MNVKNILRRLTHATVVAACGAAVAASTFIPSEQPFGYIAPPALDRIYVGDGKANAYVPWFDYAENRGDLLAVRVGNDGRLNLAVPDWSAAAQVDDQDWDTRRYIVTVDDNGKVVPFRKKELGKDQVKLFKKDEEKRINFLRGDRSNEGKKFRTRTSVLGDIIHSNPVYVGKPSAGLPFDGYMSWASANNGRPGRVYVGANDGMVHAFDAATGDEVFAYVPSLLLETLKEYSEDNYTHRYYVDGPQVAHDAYFNGGWHTVLVGGLGAGGKGLYALDVTSAGNVVDESNGPFGAGSRVLWEFTASSLDGGNLGFAYSRPSIVKMNNGRWAAVVGNGYLSSTGRAALFVLDIEDGSVMTEITVPDSQGNGLSSPTLIDIDGDFDVDYGYAGDLNGSLWKFDLTSSSAAGWRLAYGGEAMFQTEIYDGERQPITSAPEVGYHPEGGYFVYVGTGRLLSSADADDKTRQAVYGIWDNYWGGDIVPIQPADLLEQKLREADHPVSAGTVRTATANEPDWSGSTRGWRVTLEVEGATTDQRGERILQDPLLRNGRLQMLVSNPTTTEGENWYLQLDATSGGAPSETILDLNLDGAFDITDNTDGDGDGSVDDAPEDRVVGEYKQFGLASRPVVGLLSPTDDAVIFNHLAAVNQSRNDNSDDDDDDDDDGGDDGDPDPGDDDYGLVGGHMDLDVSSQTYPFDQGRTDKHNHEWDNHHGTVVDFLDIAGGFRSVDDTDGLPGTDPSRPFIITVTNAHLSPGGVIEINGVTWPVVDYRALIKRYLNGWLGPDEKFPVYKLGPVSAAEADAGMVQLTSFKMMFARNTIEIGGLIPTKTGCVKSNIAGPFGEYRSGALTTQVLDASEIDDGYTYNEVTETWDIPGGGSHRIHRLGYAQPVSNPDNDGMLWESTLFWHWNGNGCYTAKDWDDFQEDYAERMGLDPAELDMGSDDDIIVEPPGDDGSDDGDGDGDGDGDDDGGDGDDDGSGGDDGSDDDGESRDEDASEHETSTSVVAADDQLGRLFWREWVPDN